MNWRRGLLRLWVVATALWMVSVVAVCEFLGNEYEFRGVQAVELSAEYWYYRGLRPDLVAKKRQLLADVDDPLSPHYCVSYEQREREKDELAKLEKEEANNRPPEPPPLARAGRAYGLYSILESATKAPTTNAKGHVGSSQETKGTLADLIRLEMRTPECSAEVVKAKNELDAVIDRDDFPDWARDALLSLAYWLFGPPIAVLILGASLLWALTGFRTR